MTTAIETVFLKQEPAWSGDEDEEQKTADHDCEPDSVNMEFEVPLVEVKVEICEDTEYVEKQGTPNDNAAVSSEHPDGFQKDPTAIYMNHFQWPALKTSTTKSDPIKIKKPEATCKVCAKTLLKVNLMKHVLRFHPKSKAYPKPEPISTDAKTYPCPTCERVFYNNTSLALHLRIHVKKEYICKVCPQELKLSCTNPKHKKVIFKGNKKMFPCEYCEKKFVNIRRLEDHVRSHTKEKPFTCNVCDKSFTLRSHLYTHVKTHSVEKPYACELCDKRFPLRVYLTNHIKIHTGEKPYRCEVCDRRFALRSNLNKHTKTHREVKAFICDVCQRTFSLKHYLISHLQSHTGLKPFCCDVCKKCFTSKLHLQRHSRLHTGEKPYECDICNKRFTRSNNLRDHRLRHADDQQTV